MTPKIKVNHTTNELDLSDEATMNALINADVLTQPTDKETQAAETAIKQAKGTKVSLTLNHAETVQLTRMAEIKGQSIKEFVLSVIHEQLLDSNIAKPLISAPSNLSGVAVSGKKITAPTFGRVV
ncbi:hypothetical protein N8463_02765 [Synechococcus sp. AH-601-P06]|nr:hypothetical protein [Synechococcus sp. AH-601-P06]